MLQSFRSSIFRRHALLVVVAIVSSRASLLGHDMWIDPTAFSPDSGQIVGVRLRVGQDLLGDPLPRDPALINQFIFEDAAGMAPIRPASCAWPCPACSSSAIAATRAQWS